MVSLLLSLNVYIYICILYYTHIYNNNNTCIYIYIQSAIESIGEASVFAEKNGVDSKQVIDLLSNTIFDCLIYKVQYICEYGIL